MRPASGIRHVALVLVMAWLVGLVVLMSTIPFNKYDGAVSPIVDCDTDAETAVVLFVVLACVTVGIVAVWHRWRRPAAGPNVETACLVVAIVAGAVCALTAGRLVAYRASVTASACAGQGF